MFGWLKKLGGGKPCRNAAGLDEASLDRLSTDFGSLETLRPGLRDRVLRYVLDGDDPGVLTDLAVAKGAGTALGLLCCQEHYRDDAGRRTEFFDKLNVRNAPFLLRLARSWEAASRSEPRRLCLSLPWPDLEWLEIFLRELTLWTPHRYPPHARTSKTMDAEIVEAMIEADGKSASILVQAVFSMDPVKRFHTNWIPMFVCLQGFAGRAVHHASAVLEALSQADVARRLHVLSWLQEAGVEPTPFLERLAELGVSTSKQVREHAEALLRRDPEASCRALERHAAQGTNEERILALKLIWRLEGESARAFLETRLTQETNRRVQEALQGFLVIPPAAAPAPALPPIADVPVKAPLSEEVRRTILASFSEIVKEIEKQKKTPYGKHLTTEDYTPEKADDLFRLLQTLVAGERSAADSRGPRIWLHELWKSLKPIVARPEFKAIHLVRLALIFGAISFGEGGGHSLSSWFDDLWGHYSRTHSAQGDLRELAAVFRTVGLDPALIGRHRLDSYRWRFWSRPFNHPSDLVWPYFAERLELLRQCFEPSKDYFFRHRRTNALEVLASFPSPPAELSPILWEIALGGNRTDREEAQKCLEKAPGKDTRILQALADRKAETRSVAAEWLGRMKNHSAVDPLLAAVRKEKNDIAKSAMMSALESLGVPLEQFLDRKSLLEEAKTGLSKGVPSDLEWFPFSRLPAVHWADEGQAVDPDILKWFLVHTCRSNDPEPNPLLRQYAKGMKAAEREAFGQFVLETWVGQDTAPIERSEAENRAQKLAQQYVQWMTQYPQYFASKTYQQYYDELLPGILKTCKGSAIASKGILAVAAACGGPGVAPVANRYLRQWYGIRLAQGRALVQMLGWVEHPTSIQLVLAVGTRFRTKSIQDEAGRQAQAIAERRGWSLDELADRTIPSAGFDENGEMTLDYGPRQFTARLGEDLSITLTNSDGKTLASLPDARAGDDEERVKEAKKLFSSSKKELKSALKMQGDRLYEAMCTERGWRFEEWDLYLNRHPIMRICCRKVVWMAVREDSVAVTFRPMEDETLTDAKDDAVRPSPEDSIRVAHDSKISPETSQAWLKHLADYEIEPLFQQFGRARYSLPEERKEESEISEFMGHVLEAFKLRGKATQLGYMRGQAEDGGWYFRYHKRFPTLRLEVNLEFTGNSLPEENRLVALRSLWFSRLEPEGGAGGSEERVPLGGVPSVLLTECWNDLRSLAAQGPGFDPAWEKKTEP